MFYSVPTNSFIWIDHPSCKPPTPKRIPNSNSPNPMTDSIWTPRNYSRREWLARSGGAFGLLALADLLAAESAPPASAEPDRVTQPYAVRPTHHLARAKRVIFLYMPGGPSHVDLF